MAKTRAVLGSVANYVLNHPEEWIRTAKNAARLRFGVPIAALRWLANELGKSPALSELSLEAVPPGIRLATKLAALGTSLGVSADLYVDRVLIDATQVRFELRIRNLLLEVLDDSETPLATLIRSGALDLRKPGNLVRYMPKRPGFLVEADDDRVVIDLARHPAFRGKWAAQSLRLVTPLVTLSAIETDAAHLDIELKPLKDGLKGAWHSLKNGGLVRPA
jgi:hypothetical protein